MELKQYIKYCAACSSHPTDYNAHFIDTGEDEQWCEDRSCNDCIHNCESTNGKRPHKPLHTGLMDQFDNIKL